MATNITNKEKVIYPELSYLLMGILFEVHNKLGTKYQEKHYQKAVSVALKANGLQLQEQKPIKLVYKDAPIGIYYMDFLIEDKIILEIKRKEYFSKNNIQQVYGYLKTAGLRLGILANLTSKGLQFKRIVNEV